MNRVLVEKTVVVTAKERREREEEKERMGVLDDNYLG